MTRFLLLLVLLSAQPSGEEKIPFRNPSFEDTPRANACPSGWVSFTKNSTPDIMPGAWGLRCSVKEGRSCVGLVTREDGTREDFGQELQKSLQKGHCYTFSIYLAHLPSYVGHNQPVRLRVWGGGEKGRRDQLLDSSPLIDHADWKAYRFQFTPNADVKFITLEAYFGPGVLFKYKGNILLDQCSVIERCDRA